MSSAQFSNAVAATVRSPLLDSGGLLVAATIAAFSLLAFAFVAAGVRRRFWWWVAASVHVAAGVLLPFTRDLLSFFVLWEMVTLGAVGVLAFEPDARRLLRLYLPLQLLAAALLMSAFGAHYGVSGSLLLPVQGLEAGAGVALAALSIKAAVIPVHLWMTRTYTAVRPETAVVLSAVATKIGVFGMYRLISGGPTLEIAGGAVAVVGVIYALRQKQLRHFLAFHIVSQVGYMIAGVGSTVAFAGAGGLFHLANNVVYKGLLFMVVVMLISRFGHSNIYRMNGAGRSMPVLAVVAVVASASISGLPPFNGYVSKTVIEQFLSSPVAVALLRIAGVGTAISFTKFLWYCFFKRAEPRGAGREDTCDEIVGDNAHSVPARSRPAGGGVAVDGRPAAHASARRRIAIAVILSLACVVMGLAAVAIFPALPADAAVTLESFRFGLVPPAIGVLLFALAYSRLRPALERLPSATLYTRPLSTGATRLLRALQEQHSGDVRRYLGWILMGLIVIWAVVIL